MSRLIPLSRSVLISLALLSSCTASETDERARSIGAALCATSLSKDIDARSLRTAKDELAIGPALASALSMAGSSFAQECSVELHGGDGPAPYGDGKASHWLSLSSRGKAVMHIRLRYDADQARFTILGFWSAK